MDILLHDAEGEAEVYHLEDPVLAGPEHVGRLQVGVDNALGTALMSQVSQVCTKKWLYHLAMETVQSNKEVLGEPEAGPGWETSPLVLVDNLNKKVKSLNLVRSSSYRMHLSRELDFNLGVCVTSYLLGREEKSNKTSEFLHMIFAFDLGQ